jgi:hypothetical protein
MTLSNNMTARISDQTADDESNTNGDDNWDALGRDCSAYKDMTETLSHIDNFESIGLVIKSASESGDTAAAVAAMDRYNEVRADDDDEPEVATDGGEDEAGIDAIVQYVREDSAAHISHTDKDALTGEKVAVIVHRDSAPTTENLNEGETIVAVTFDDGLFWVGSGVARSTHQYDATEDELGTFDTAEKASDVAVAAITGDRA